jgi:hypothetical protein
MNDDDVHKLDYAGPGSKSADSKTVGEKLVLGFIIALAGFMLFPR